MASCGNDGPQVDRPKADPRVDSVQTLLNAQIEAMRTVLSEDVSVELCTRQEDGSFKVALGNGHVFYAYGASKELSPLLTYVEEAGSMYWALDRGEDAPEMLKDVSGNRFSCYSALSLKVKSKQLYLESGNAQMELGLGYLEPVQAFGFIVHEDAEGAIYALTMSFGEGKSKTFGVRSYDKVFFSFSGSSEALEECFVENGTSAELILNISEGVDYELSLSEGWSIEEGDSEVVVELIVTAPEQETETPGTLEVIIGGDFSAASLVLSTKPFKHIFTSSVNAVVAPYGSGLSSFAYGICKKSEYDGQSIKDGIEAAYKASEYVCRSISEVYGEELTDNEEYVLWACPLQNNTPGKVYTHEFGKVSTQIELTGEPTFMDAPVKVDMTGAEAVFGGLVRNTEDWQGRVLDRLNVYDPVPFSAPGKTYSFVGKASELAGGTIVDDVMPLSDCIVWFVPAVPAEYEYEYGESDIVFKEFVTSDVTEGGSIQVSVDEGKASISAGSISVPVSCSGAEMVYYAFIEGKKGLVSASADNKEKYNKLVTSGNCVITRSTSFEAKVTGLTPEETYHFFAVAIDQNGQYGEVLYKKFQTVEFQTDPSITLKVEPVAVRAQSITFQVTSNGGDLSDYIYWFGTEREYNNKFSRKDVTQYLALNTEDADVQRVMRKYGRLANDGSIRFVDLNKETVYKFVIIEKGKTYYSTAAEAAAETKTKNMGVVTADSEEWAIARNSITIDWIEESCEVLGEFARYVYEFSCPKDYTAFIVSSNIYAPESYLSVEDFMIDLEATAADNWDYGWTPLDEDGVEMNKPSYYVDGALKQGAGMMIVCDYYVHGYAPSGKVTYFAEDSHNEIHCPTWGDGSCDNYQVALNSIQEKLDRDYWREEARGIYKNWEKKERLTEEEVETFAEIYLNEYSKYYKNATPKLYMNNGSPLRVTQPYGNGIDDKGACPDCVFVLLKDSEGIYFEPMEFRVPKELFK